MNLIGTLAPDHFSLLFSSPASFPLVSFGLDRNGAGDIETEGGPDRLVSPARTIRMLVDETRLPDGPFPIGRDARWTGHA